MGSDVEGSDEPGAVTRNYFTTRFLMNRPVAGIHGIDQGGEVEAMFRTPIP